MLSHYNVIAVGETPFTHLPEEIAGYLHPQNKAPNAVFQLELKDPDVGGMEDSPVSLSAPIHRLRELTDMKECLDKRQTCICEHGCCDALCIWNHDEVCVILRRPPRCCRRRIAALLVHEGSE